MNERVKTVAMVLFLVIVGLVLYQVYFGELGLFNSPASTATPTPDATVSPTGTPVVRVIENENTNSGIKVVIPTNTPANANSNSFQADLGDPIAQLFTQAGFAQVHVEDIRQDKEIFAIRLDSLSDNISKRYVYDGTTMVGVVYAVASNVSYEQVKSGILDRISSSPVWSMNETNTYGRASFYLNNKNRADTVFLLVKFNDKTIGFEYQKNNQQKFETVFGLMGK